MADPFGDIRLATVAPGDNAPDPATFTTAYGTDAQDFIVDFELRVAGPVTFTATMSMGEMTPMAMLAVPLSGSFAPGWHYFEVLAAGAWPVGDYTATLTFVPTGQTGVIAIPIR